ITLLLSTVGIVGYFMQDSRAVLARVETYMQETHQLDLQIGCADLSSWRELHQLRVGLEEVSLSHFDDPSTVLHFDHVDLHLEVLGYWEFALRLDSVAVRGGYTQVQANSSLISALRTLAQKDNTGGPSNLSFTLASDLPLSLQQFSLLYQDSRRAKHMEGRVNSLRTVITKKGQGLAAELNANIDIERLTFNPKKGSYLAGANLRMQPSLSYEEGCLKLPDFELWLDEQRFSASAELEINGAGHFSFDLQNESTPFASTIAYVPAELRQKLTPYTIANPLATRIRVNGGFAAGDNPLARIDFHTVNNRFGFKNYPQLEEVSASGYLINRARSDTSNWASEHPLNLRLHFDQLTASYEGVQLSFPQLVVSSTPETPIYLAGSLLAEGPLQAINGLMPQGDWRVSGGEFQLCTVFAGPVEHELDILQNLEKTALEVAQVSVQNTSVDSEGFELRQASLVLDGDTLALRNAQLALADTKHEIELAGYWINNWPWQVGTDLEPESFLSCRSSYLSVATLSSSLAALVASESERSSIATIVDKVRKQFNPRVVCYIDSLELERDLAEQVVLKTSLSDHAELQIEQLSATIGGNELACSGTIDFTPTQPYWNLAVRSQGEAVWFNRLFDNTTFFFERGAFNFAGQVSGEIEHWSDLQRYAKGKLALWDGDVLVGPTAVHLPLGELKVDYSGEHLRLDAMRVPLSSGQSIEMTGEVRHFRSLISPDGDAADVSSSVQVKANRLGFDDLQRIFSSVQQFAEGRPVESQLALKPSFQALYEKFHPCLTFQLDTFQFQQFVSTDNLARVSFLDENRVTFQNTGFEFKGRPVQMSAIVDIEDAAETPFEVTVETERFDLAALVETFDYFGLTSLQRAERVAGKVSLRANLQGKIIDSVGLQKDRLLGRVHFNLHEAELVNFAPIQQVANKFFRTERLHKIRFAPITDTLLITHKVVHIPRMEIQSTAFNLFVEGHLNYDNNTNIWVSLPWQNLRSWQEGELPAKTGYAESGGKLFVEIHDDNGEMEYKFRFTNRRLYKHRGISDQYRIDKQEEHATRRAWRKERRRARRTGA
ncbi:MAG: AsmA-like C-terminal region-containing protein, partial [Bacteroidota bacterium]